MPFDMMKNRDDGGGDGWENVLGKALSIIVAILHAAEARPANFEPGGIEEINLDIQIKVTEDGHQFRVEHARMNRWEQIEVDKS